MRVGEVIALLVAGWGVVAQGAVFTWGGGTGPWSAPGSWVGNAVPPSGAGTSLVFPAGAYTSTNNLGTFEAGAITINNGARVVWPLRIGPNFEPRPLYVGTLTFAGTGTLDMTDNDIVANGGGYNAFKTLFLAGYSSTPNPALTGLISTHEQNSVSSSVPYGCILEFFDNSQIAATEWPLGSGHAISPGAIVAKYTWVGDANFDGQVTGDDYGVIDANLGTTPQSGVEWLTGDVNGSGQVTAADYTVVVPGVGTAQPLAPLSIVPEPGVALSLLGMAGLFGIRARRVR